MELKSNLKLRRENLELPAELHQFFGSRIPKGLIALGNANIRKSKKLALLCSVKCPGDLILKTFDLMQALRDNGIVVISGFHSPMEKECLRILLKGQQPIIIILPRTLDNMRIPSHYQEPLASGRLLIISRFKQGEKRVTKETSTTNNRFLVALSDAIFIPYATPGGKTEQLCREVASRNLKIYTFSCEKNRNLLEFGAIPVTNSTWIKELKDLGSH